MEIAKTIASARKVTRQARDAGKKIGLVPTMGALHAGHISLIEAAVKQCDFVVVSIFVNPTQFGPSEDLGKYPRPLEDDLEICEKTGVDIVFLPSDEEMYGDENLTWVNVEQLTESLCGQFRPEHFRGVTTICTKLFNIITPDMAYFGQKDAQQAIVLKRMVADLNMNLKIVICPTVREPDGLAISSRNKYLSEQQRKDALYIYEALQKARQMIEAGTKDIEPVIEQMRSILSVPGTLNCQYLEIVDAETLQKLDKIKGKVLIAIAVGIGNARLIDNMVMDTTFI